jgi:hypothetical protein
MLSREEYNELKEENLTPHILKKGKGLIEGGLRDAIWSRAPVYWKNEGEIVWVTWIGVRVSFEDWDPSAVPQHISYNPYFHQALPEEFQRGARLLVEEARDLLLDSLLRCSFVLGRSGWPIANTPQFRDLDATVSRLEGEILTKRSLVLLYKDISVVLSEVHDLPEYYRGKAEYIRTKIEQYWGY